MAEYVVPDENDRIRDVLGGKELLELTAYADGIDIWMREEILEGRKYGVRLVVVHDPGNFGIRLQL